MKWEAKCQTQPDNPQYRSQNPLWEKEKGSGVEASVFFNF